MDSRRASISNRSKDIQAVGPQFRDKSALASPPEDFLPDMCTLQAVFFLVLLGELLALVLTLADSGLAQFDWEGLGLRSVLIQWIGLLSAALLCRLRPWLARQPAWKSGVVCYLAVLAVTLACTALALYALQARINGLVLLGNFLLSAIIAGIILRYLYLQQQLHNQQQAELQARIQALQSRIQPHFLFNSMNSIASLIAVDPDTAERMVEDLSCLFRASLAEPSMVSLADELELCQQYAAIEQMRLGERLRLTWHLDEPVSAHQHLYQIPSLLLQPLIENAIVHGIQPAAAGGDVDVHLRIEGDGLSIRVENPLLVAAEGAASSRGNRLALDNIAHRLQAHFGPKAYIEAGEQGATFVTTIFYPLPVGSPLV